jgi:hypothetical protein
MHACCMESAAHINYQYEFRTAEITPDKILAGCGGSVSLLVRPMFTLLYFTLLHAGGAGGSARGATNY